MSKRQKINWTIKKIVIIFALVFLIFPHFTLAQSATITTGCDIPPRSATIGQSLGVVVDTYKPITINFNLPGVTTKIVDENGKTQYQVKNLQCFIVGIYVYFSGVAGILATVMIMYGGVKYVISMGNPSRMGDAKDTIFSAVVGLVLVLGAYVLLNLINPNITQLEVPGLDLTPVTPDSFCIFGAEPVEPGKILCGDRGVNPGDDKECVFSDCTSDLAAPGWATSCVKGTETDPNADGYSCMHPKNACDRVTEDNARAESQIVCNEYTIENKGKCIWSDNADQCIWYPVMNCPDNTWTQTSCQKCVDASASCGEKTIGFDHTLPVKLPFICQDGVTYKNTTETRNKICCNNGTSDICTEDSHQY